jgi:hypothetical protein
MSVTDVPRLSPEQRELLTVDELARMILGVLQNRERMGPARWQHENTRHPWALSAIRDAMIDEGTMRSISHMAAQEEREAFEFKFEQARTRLVTRGLICRDTSQNSDGFMKPTKEGMEAQASGPILGIASADEYIVSLERDCGQLDRVVEAYLRESYRAAVNDLWLAATFMAGAAAERLLFLLAEHVALLLKDPAESNKVRKVWNASELKGWVVKNIPTLRKARPQSVTALRDLDDALATLYTLHRYQRNDVGHPKDRVPAVDSAQTKAMIMGFGTYAKRASHVLEIQP